MHFSTKKEACFIHWLQMFAKVKNRASLNDELHHSSISVALTKFKSTFRGAGKEKGGVIQKREGFNLWIPSGIQ